MDLVLDLIMLIGAIVGLGGSAWIYLDARRMDAADAEHSPPKADLRKE